MKTMFIGVIIVAIIALVVLLALNLFVSLDGSGLGSITGYDCAKNWDIFASSTFEVMSGGDLAESAKHYAKADKVAKELQENNCPSTVDE
jgi:hypothetical protein